MCSCAQTQPLRLSLIRNFNRTDITVFTGEGLEKNGASLSQIPTYVTGVPNGTEKVSFKIHPLTSVCKCKYNGLTERCNPGTLPSC